MRAKRVPMAESTAEKAADALRRNPHLSVDDVAKRAGVSRATLYRRTGGRRALLGDDDARDRILDAALHILFREGIARATIANVAERAKVAPVTVYRLFGDRARLFAAVAERAPARRAGKQLALAATDDVEQDLTAFVATVLRFMGENRKGFASALSSLHEPENHALFEALHGGQTRTAHHIEAYLKKQAGARRLPKIGDARKTAVSLFALIAGFGFLAPTLGVHETRDVDDTARFIVRFFLRGIGHAERRTRP